MIMFFKILKDTSLLTVLSEITTIWGFVYALPNFVEQLRLQNASENAGKSLDVCIKVEKAIDCLLSKEGQKDNQWEKAKREAYEVFRDLKGHLELLQKFGSEIKRSLKWIDTMLNLLKEKDNNRIIIFFEQGDVESEFQAAYKELEALRAKLKGIHSVEPKKLKNIGVSIFWLIAFTLIYIGLRYIFHKLTVN